MYQIFFDISCNCIDIGNKKNKAVLNNTSTHQLKTIYTVL